MKPEKEPLKIYGMNIGNDDGGECVMLDSYDSEKQDYIFNMENAKECMNLNKFEEAEKYILNAIKYKMTSDALNLFVINCMKMDKIDKAETYLNSWLRDNKPEEKGILYFQLGTVYEVMLQYDNAIQHYRASLGYGCNDACFFLGRIYTGILDNTYKDLDGAFFYFDSAYYSELSFSKGILCDLVMTICEIEGLKDKKETWEKRKNESLLKTYFNSVK